MLNSLSFFIFIDYYSAIGLRFFSSTFSVCVRFFLVCLVFALTASSRNGANTTRHSEELEKRRENLFFFVFWWCSRRGESFAGKPPKRFEPEILEHGAHRISVQKLFVIALPECTHNLVERQTPLEQLDQIIPIEQRCGMVCNRNS